MTARKTIPLLLLISFALLLNACRPTGLNKAQQSTIPAATAGQKSRCGDSVCAAPENASNCPNDCAQTGTPAEPESPQLSSAKPGGQGILYIGLMVHLEGWDDGKNQQRFKDHARLMRDYATLFEKYGAKITWESKEVTEGIIRWGDNVLLEMQQRGHAVGLHADLGGSPKDDCNQLEPNLLEMKCALENLGVTVRHTSGITSHCDWVSAAAGAGFQFVTGVVAYGLKSLPLEKQPQQIRICRTPAACHDPYPFTLEERLHPWRASSGSNWIDHDPAGQVVIVPENGGLSHKFEDMHGADSSGKDAEFNAADVDALITELEEAISLAAADQVNTYYLSWSLGSALDKALLEQWLQRVDGYVKTGKVQWKTIPEMVDVYLAWEKTG